LHQAGEECAGGDRLAKRAEEVNRTGGQQKCHEQEKDNAEALRKSREEGTGKIEKRN
jgi:hypothetical protein